MKSASRMVLAAWLAACASVAWPQDLGQRVTFSSPAKRLDVLVAELTQRSGVPISAHRDVANEVVIVQVTDVALSDLLDQIAAVTSGEVGRDGQGGVQIRRSRELVRRQEREAIAGRAAAIRKVLQEWEQTLSRLEGLHPREVNQFPRTFVTPFEFVSERDPVGRALMRMALLIRPEVLAGIGEGERVVFSTHPNRMQVGLGPRSERVVASLIREQQAHLIWPGRTDPPLDADDEFLHQVHMQRKQNPLTQPVAEALLVASVGQIGPSQAGELIRLELRAYDEAGNVMLVGQASLGGDRYDMPVLPGLQAEPPDLHPHSRKVIELSPLAKEMRQFTAMSMQHQVRSPSPELIEALRRPDLVDPHSFITSEATMAVAAVHGLQLVANFPDCFVPRYRHATRPSVGGPRPPRGLTVGAWEQTLATAKELAVSKREGWMVVQPAHPVESRRTRMDRVALARLIQAIEQEGSPSLEALAEYAAVSSAPRFRSLEMPYLDHWDARLHMGLQGGLDWKLLRFYGRLTGGQRERLAMGRPIPFATLTSDQREALQQLLFRSDVRFVPRSRPVGHIRSFTEIHNSGNPPAHFSRRDEPTEIMPDGIPREGSVSVENRQTFFLRPVPPDGSLTAGFGPIPLDEFAYFESMRLATDGEDDPGFFPVMRHVRAGQRRVLDFTFDLSPDTVFRGTLMDDAIAGDAPVMAKDDLSPEVMAQLRPYFEAYQSVARRLAEVGRRFWPGRSPETP